MSLLAILHKSIFHPFLLYIKPFTFIFRPSVYFRFSLTALYNHVKFRSFSTLYCLSPSFSDRLSLCIISEKRFFLPVRELFTATFRIHNFSFYVYNVALGLGHSIYESNSNSASCLPIFLLKLPLRSGHSVSKDTSIRSIWSNTKFIGNKLLNISQNFSLIISWEEMSGKEK